MNWFTIVLSAILLSWGLVGCDWDGSVYLDERQDTDTNDTQTDGDTTTETEQDSESDYWDDSDNCPDYDPNPNIPDLVTGSVSVPPDFHDDPVRLCWGFIKNPYSADWNLQKETCRDDTGFNESHTRHISLHHNELCGNYYVGAILSALPPGENPSEQPYLYYFGFTDYPVALYPGSNVQDVENITLMKAPL